MKSCSHASAMECDTFGCVIKSRVTRALYIIHAATPLTAPLASSSFLFFRIYHPSSMRGASFFFPHPSFFSRHIPHSGFISRGRSARFANILAACYVGNTRGNFIGPTRSACAIFIAPPSHRPLSQLFPVKCHKAKFSDRVWSWLRATSWVLTSPDGRRTTIIQVARVILV